MNGTLIRNDVQTEVHKNPEMFGSDLKLLIVDHTNYQLVKHKIKQYRICQRDIISEGFEKMTYSVLGDEDFLGFFLIHRHSLECAVSLIIDLHASSSGSKLEAAGFHNLSLVDFSEITLLCSNSQARVKGAARELMTLLLSVLCSHQRNTILWVANADRNPRPFQFYADLGFKRLGHLPAMVYGPCRALIEEVHDSPRATPTTTASGGTVATYTIYNGHRYRIHTGSRGGKYILHKSQKRYI